MVQFSAVSQPDWHCCLPVPAYHAFCRVPVQILELTKDNRPPPLPAKKGLGRLPIVPIAPALSSVLLVIPHTILERLISSFTYPVPAKTPCFHSCRYRFANSCITKIVWPHAAFRAYAKGHRDLK